MRGKTASSQQTAPTFYCLLPKCLVVVRVLSLEARIATSSAFRPITTFMFVVSLSLGSSRVFFLGP